VSDPENADVYGKYKTHKEVGDLTANLQSSQYVLDYLDSKFSGRAIVTERTVFDEYIRGSELILSRSSPVICMVFS